MTGRCDRDKSYNQFVYYWTLYRQHYGRHLYKLRNDTHRDQYMYKTAGQKKRYVCTYWNKWLTLRDEHDIAFTVLCGNCQQFTIGAVYRVNVTPSHILYVFRVITSSKIYEWYITSNTFETGYIGPVPAHRVGAHTTCRSWLNATETFIDDNYNW